MKTTFLKTALGLFIALNVNLTSAQAWVSVGDVDFPYTEYSTLALDSNDVPYIFYKNYFEGNTGFVMKFENDSWNAVGEEGFSETIYPGEGAAVGWRTHTLVLDSNDIPYVAYANTDGKAVVKKLENNQWQTVGGETVSEESATAFSLAFDNNNIPYIFYMDWNINGLIVKKLGNNGWETVGSTVSSNPLVSYSEISFDSNNNLYIAYSGITDIWSPNVVVRIKKLDDDISWQDVGEIISTGQEYNRNITLAIDSQDVPYIAYNQSLNTILVKKFEENNWQTVGEVESSSENDLIFASFAINSNDIPYISYSSIANSTDITTTIKKYEDSAWQTIGVTNQFNGTPAVTFDSNNIPYAVFTTTGSTTVMKYDPTAGIETTIFNEVAMYPNPANGVVYINNLPDKATVTITDMTGKRVYSTKESSHTLSIDTAKFAKGIYPVQITSNGKSMSKKLVVN